MTTTPDELMLAAKNKYDTMVEKRVWNAPTSAEKIVVSEAKLASTMKNLNKKVLFEMNKKKGHGKIGNSAKKGRFKSDDRDEDHPKHRKPPKPGDKKEITYKGQHQWHWCGNDTGGKCEKWRAHKPDEYQGGTPFAAKRGAERDSKKTKKEKGSSVSKEKLKIAKAYVARPEKKRDESEDVDTDNDSI